VNRTPQRYEEVGQVAVLEGITKARQRNILTYNPTSVVFWSCAMSALISSVRIGTKQVATCTPYMSNGIRIQLRSSNRVRQHARALCGIHLLYTRAYVATRKNGSCSAISHLRLFGCGLRYMCALTTKVMQTTEGER
jgi:hypothetical protein